MGHQAVRSTRRVTAVHSSDRSVLIASREQLLTMLLRTCRPTPPKTSPFSKASSPFAAGRACTSAASARPACIISSGKSSTTPIDEAMNGHASNIAVTLHKDGVVDHDSGRRARHSGRQASADEDERARGDLHDAPRRRQVRRPELQDGRRSARRRRVGRQRAVARARRDRPARRRHLGAEIQAGHAASAA